MYDKETKKILKDEDITKLPQDKVKPVQAEDKKIVEFDHKKVEFGVISKADGVDYFKSYRKLHYKEKIEITMENKKMVIKTNGEELKSIRIDVPKEKEADDKLAYIMIVGGKTKHENKKYINYALTALVIVVIGIFIFINNIYIYYIIQFKFVSI